MITSLQSFLELATVAIQKLSPEQKLEFREAWRAQYDGTSLRLTQSDLQWLKKIKIGPSGD
jgi:hypothetical protein